MDRHVCEKENTRVILMGGNHHNGLGLVRCFGKHNIHPYGIVIGHGAKDSFIRKSKYWKATWSAKDEGEALAILHEQFADGKRTVLIPWSDGAAVAIDSHLSILNSQFICPSINNRENAIVELMNKESQVEFAKKFGIRMLNSSIVDLSDAINNIPDFPVILKPVTSVEGSKDDMHICNTVEEFDSALSYLSKKNYHRILVQQYLNDKKEFVVTGSVTDKSISFSVVLGLRQWPIDFGTGSYSLVVVEEKYNQFCKQVLESVQKFGYIGLIDFEFFEDGSQNLYLNELNWRSSGRNFVYSFTGIDSAYIYYCERLGIDCLLPRINQKSGYNMNDATDLKHVFKKDISLACWIKDLKRTKSFAVWDYKDLAPVFNRYLRMIKRIVRKEVHL